MRLKKVALVILFVLIFMFLFVFFFNLYAAGKQCVWTDVKKIIAIGDVHGDYKNFVTILKGTKLIDDNLHWTGGKTHLVQTGDVLDRGPEAKKTFDLLITLEKEAEEAGGKVHMLIGNHEEMNITGLAFDSPGYVTVNQFISFIPENYKEKKEKEFRKKMGNDNANETDAANSSGLLLEKFWEETMANDSNADMEYFKGFNEKYGKWILDHNVVIKINDIIFTHGGISEEFSTWKLEDINDQTRKELKALQDARIYGRPYNSELKIVYQSQGPLWFRGLALMSEEYYQKDVDKILNNLGVKHIVIAHTPRKGSILQRFQKKIWIIDTGISDIYGGHLSALIIEDGEFQVWGASNEK